MSTRLEVIHRLKLVAGWICALFLLAYLTIAFRMEVQTFIGVMEAEEFALSYPQGTEVIQLTVAAGDRVEAGQTVAKLRDPELEMKISTVEHELKGLLAQQSLNRFFNSASVGVSESEIAPGNASPVAIQIGGLQRELKLLHAQRESLELRAEIPGAVTMTHFKIGERVPPFTPIVTLHREKPTYVKGFLPEALKTKLNVDDTVWIRATTDSSRKIEGKVVSIGTRLVPCPERIDPRPGPKSWGRELIVKVPESAPFFLAEKVQLDVRDPDRALGLLRLAGY